MKKFKFRLEKVWQFRLTIKEERLRTLHEAFRVLRQAEEDVAMREEAYSQNRIEVGAVLAIEQIQMRAAYSERLKGEITNLNLRILDLKGAVEVARAAYIAANQDAQVLEKLKERKKVVHNEMVAKAEEQFLDELTTQKGNPRNFQKG